MDAAKKKGRLALWLAMVTLLVVTGTGMQCAIGSGDVAMKEKMMKIKTKMSPLASVSGDDYPECVRTYFDYYGLDFERSIPDVEHFFGTFPSGGEILAGHLYRPSAYKATVILLHGYMNHTAQFRRLIPRLLSDGYAVGTYDMQGHGLSTGKRAAIDDFAQYTRSLDDYMKVAADLADGPYHLIGFSTGGTVAIDKLLRSDDSRFEKVVLAAPLVRSVAWASSKAGYRLYNNFADSVPRTHRRNSSDKDFLKFNRNDDVLHVQKVSLDWVKALHDWNDSIADAAPSERSIAVIQGEKDTTVSYKYNLKFLKGKFKDVKIAMLENARHELFNESEALRNEVIDCTIKYLEE